MVFVVSMVFVELEMLEFIVPKSGLLSNSHLVVSVLSAPKSQ